MSVDPLKSLGYWSGKELAFEGAVPLNVFLAIQEGAGSQVVKPWFAHGIVSAGQG